MDNISKIGANANFYVNNQSVKKENDSKKADEKKTHRSNNPPGLLPDRLQVGIKEQQRHGK